MPTHPPLPDRAFEAGALRAALLVGLVDEVTVLQWADECLQSDKAHIAELSEIAVTRPELTALREALRPLTQGLAEEDIARSICRLLTVTLRGGTERSVTGLRALEDIRREGWLYAEAGRAAKGLEDRANLARVGMEGVTAPTHGDVLDIVDQGEDLCFVLPFADAGERDAFVGALSRKFVRDRRAGDPAAIVWAPSPEDASRPCVILNYDAYLVAQRMFGPLPVGATLPYAIPGDRLRRLIDSTSVEALGMEAAAALSTVR